MTVMKILALITFLLIEAVVLIIFFSERIRKTVIASSSRKILTFVGIQGIFGVLLLLGAYFETRWQPISELREFLETDKVELLHHVSLQSDPGLLRMLEQGKSIFPRPDFSTRHLFEQWQTSLRNYLLKSIFKIPDIQEAQIVKFERHSQTEIGPSLTRTFVSFETFDGSYIPAYLFEPTHITQAPAVLVIPGHVKDRQSGLAQTSGLIASYQHGAALRLAEAGFVTLTFELRGFGELGRPRDTEHRLVAWNAILAGTFYKAVIVQDIKRAIDLLRALPPVNPERVGITGTSYGGELAVTYAALDERIKAASFHSYGGSLGRASGIIGTKKAQPHYDHVIPGSSTFLHKEDMIWLVALRALQGVRGDRDDFADPNFTSAVRQGWRVFDTERQLELLTVPGGHEYFIDPAVRFFRSRL